ncbi:V-type ATP synthase subunit E [Candidatus Bathyarchaeota archaeon]|nr:V-type ATP synthase subunit E [Candidatus Bathyarchaeota archaeon]
MEVSTLISEVERQAMEEAEKIIAKAREEAEKIIEDAKKKAEEIRNKQKQAVMRELEQKKTVSLATIRLEGKRKVLEVKYKYLRLALDKAEEILKEKAETGDEDYLKALERLLVEALSQVDGEAVIFVNERDRRRVEGILEKLGVRRATLSDRHVDITGGVIVQSRNGKQIFNNSLDARLNKIKDEIGGELIEILFGGS